MKKVRSQKAFTLVELMVVIVIVGIISTIAIPGYKKYREKAKKAESYQNIGVITKTQKTYLLEHGQFMSLDANGGPLVAFSEDWSWKELGYPVAAGSQTTFQYFAYAGKFDSTGTYIAWTDNGIGNLYHPLDSIFEMSSGITLPGVGNTCRISGFSNTRPFGYGVRANPGEAYDWLLIITRAPLNLDTECSYVIKLVEETPNQDLNQGKPPIEIKVLPGGGGEIVVG